MVRTDAVVDKIARERFLEPWDEESPEWQDIDGLIEPAALVRRIDRAVNLLDLSELFASYKGRGKLPYRPDLLLKVVLYETRRGRPSPKQWHEDLKYHKAVQWLARGIAPSLTQLYAFRDRVGPFIDEWNRQTLHTAVEQGWTDVSEGSDDGTFVAANASRYKTVTQETLDRHIQQLEEAIAFDEAGESPTRQPAWMAKTASGRKRQLKRHYRALQRMNELQKKNERRRADKRKKPEQIRVSVSDPDTVFGRDKLKVFRPLYNVQLIGDLNSPFILGYDVFMQASDNGTLQPMFERVVDLTGCKLITLLADSAYATPQDLEFCDSVGVTLYAPWQENDYTSNKTSMPPQIPKEKFEWIAEEQAYRCPDGCLLPFDCRTSKQRTSGETIKLEIYRCEPQHCLLCQFQPQCTQVPHKGRTVRRHEQQDLIDGLCNRMQTEEAKALYTRRASTIERLYADMKEHRNIRKFSGRGLQRAKTQIGLSVLAHNLLAALTFTEKEIRERHDENVTEIAA